VRSQRPVDNLFAMQNFAMQEMLKAITNIKTK